MKTELEADVLVDCRGETCPIPLVEMRKAVIRSASGQVIEITGTHGPSKEEIPMAAESLGLDLLGIEEDDGTWRIFISARGRSV